MGSGGPKKTMSSRHKMPAGYNVPGPGSYNISRLPMEGIPEAFGTCQPRGPPPVAPGPPVPAPAPPAAGECSAAAAGVSLLYQFPRGDLVLNSTDASVAEVCAARCAADRCCAGYTWHDATCGSYSMHCYFVLDVRSVWERAFPQAGHVSGLCNDQSASPAGCTTQGAACVAAAVTCRSTGVPLVDGPLGVATGSAEALIVNTTGGGSSVPVDVCMQHLPDMGNNWPSNERPCLHRACVCTVHVSAPCVCLHRCWSAQACVYVQCLAAQPV